MSTPILTVTWDTVIGAHATDHDPETGATDFEPVSLGEAVVDSMAEQLLRTVDHEVEDIRRRARERLRDEVSKVRTEVIREEVTAMVRNQLAKPIQKTNTWGEPTGEPTTLNDLITAEVKAYLSETPPRPGYSERERAGGLVQLIRTEVGDALQKELRAAIVAARAEVAGKVRDRAAEIIGAVVQADVR